MIQIIRYTALCFFLIIPAMCWSQSDTLYFDEFHQKTTKDIAKIYWVCQLIPGHHYKVSEYKINTQHLTMTGIYANLDDKKEDGSFVYYDDSGFIFREGIYAYGKEVGEWKQYYPNSKLLWCVSHFNNGEPAGQLISYYKDGKIKRQETDSGRIATGKCYDTTGKEIPFTQFEIMPKPSFDLPKFLQKNLRYPNKAREQNITGRVVVKFVVNEDGSISDVEIVRDLSPEIDKEAIRVISKMPPWNPAKQDDKPVKVPFTQPITFNLNYSKWNQ